MSDNERVRASISATMDEIVRGHQALGLPIDREDFEAYEILHRIERRILAQRKADAA